MGEASGCLMRSLSSPISSEFKEGDPLRALTTSISFGRFMKEPLDWEKWSSFTHNRNLEEVEKYSKPGSVAAKKAYFEAHYKNIAAKKKAAALIEQENKAPNRSPEPNSTKEVLCNSSMDSDLANEQQNVSRLSMTWKIAQANPPELNPTSEIRDNSSTDSSLGKSNSLDVSRASFEPVSSVHINGCDMNVEANEYSTTGTEQSQAVPEEVVLSKVDIQVDLNVEANVHCTTEMERSQSDMNVEAIEYGTTRAEQSMEVPEEVVLSESPIKVAISNQLESVENHSEITAIQAETTLFKDATNNGAKGLPTKKKPAIPSSKSSVNNGAPKLRAPVKSSIPVHPRKIDSATFDNKKAVSDLIERKRLTPQSLHMSINFGSSTRESTKRSSPVLHKNGNAKIPKIVVKTTKERHTQQAPIRASMNGEVSKHSLIIPQHENRRSRTPLDRSVRDSRTIVGSHCVYPSESLCASAKKPRPPTVFSSFVLRSDERAAKRKEFFQKLEEKVNVTETETIQRQTKSKVAPTRPRSPNLGRKPSSSPRKIQDISSRPPRGSTFTKTDHSKNFIERNKLNLTRSDPSKNFIERNKLNLTRSVTSLTKKKIGENASPNIQL